MESLLFLALTPLAAALMLAVAAGAWARRRAPEARGLVAFALGSAGWLVCDALSLAAPSPEATLRLGQAAFAWAPLPGVAWLAFLIGYTGTASRPARWALGALTAWCLAFGALALTTDAHGLVWASWQTVADGPFLRAAYEIGPVAWAQALLMWAVTAASLGVLLWAYAGARARERDLSRWIVVGALVPLAVNVAHIAGFGPVEKDFTPVAMAVSAGAFALGLARYRLLDLLPIARAALVDRLAEGVVVLDADGRVADVNPALAGVLGAEQAVPGRPLAATAPALAAALDAGRPTLELGGRTLDLHVSSLADGAVAAGRLVLLRDVTDARRQRAALHRANAELYDANAALQARNDELDAFAHTVAHDLKNSVQGIAGWAEILRDEGPGLPAEEHHRIAAGVARSAHKMGGVVHELLLLAGVRQAAVEPGPVAMGPVLAAALDRLGVAGQRPVLAAAPERWPVAVAHGPWVEEIWVNYLSNAAKYGGPTVTLGADVREGHARFWVHDDGPGLSAEAQRQLFAPFARVGARAAEGHGLGLSIVRRIAERLGGTCGVESGPGRGTRFWFAFPLAEPVAA